MASLGRIPGLPFDLTDDVNQLIDRMSTLDPSSAPMVEPAILSPFSAVGDFVNFSGPPGCGKSRLAADVIVGAVCPSREGSALGGLLRFDRDLLGRGPVAIIDGEGNIARWGSMIRRRMLADGFSLSAADHAIKYMRPSDLGLHRTGDWEEASLRLAQALAVIKANFLVADTLGRIWAPSDINSTEWIQRGLAPFRTACQEYGISALLLSHTKRRKGREDLDPVGPIGSSFQEAQVDGQIIMSRMKGGHGLVLTHLKSRRSFWIQQGSRVTLHFKPGLGYEPQSDWQHYWPHECPDYDVEDPEPDPCSRSRVLQILRDKAPDSISRQDIEAQLGLSERAVRKHLTALSAAGQAERVGKSSSTQWKLRGAC